MFMSESTLERVGGPSYRKSEKCEICKRSFGKIPFGHQFKTSWGSIDVCEPCAEDIYQTVMADVAGGIFSLKRDINEVRNFIDGLANSKKWREIIKDSKSIKTPRQNSATGKRGYR